MFDRYDDDQYERLIRMSWKEYKDYWNEDKRAFKEEELEYELGHEYGWTRKNKHLDNYQ
jgi:hypothetical protein